MLDIITTSMIVVNSSNNKKDRDMNKMLSKFLFLTQELDIGLKMRIWMLDSSRLLTQIVF
jgi:hypothetical protein